MEREIADRRSPNFDILVIDGFTSDAIPVHLLTREAFAVYLQQLAPDGVLPCISAIAIWICGRP